MLEPLPSERIKNTFIMSLSTMKGNKLSRIDPSQLTADVSNMINTDEIASDSDTLCIFVLGK
jgi:hypothetical protein